MVITASCSMLLSKCTEAMYAHHVTRARAIFPFIDSKLAAPSRPICHVLVHILSLLGRPKPKTLNASQISLNLSEISTDTEWDEHHQWQHNPSTWRFHPALMGGWTFPEFGASERLETLFWLSCIGEGQCRWNCSCTARSSWGSEQVWVNECTRGAEGISNCVLWERMLP